MKEIFLNNLNNPGIMKDYVVLGIMILASLSVIISGLRYIRNYIVEHREGIFKAVDEFKTETKKWRSDPEVNARLIEGLVLAIVSILASSVRFITKAACIGRTNHIVVTENGINHEEEWISPWWGPNIRNTIWFALLSIIGVAILTHYTEQLPIALAWALWIALSWVILWNFPNIGLFEIQHLLIYSIPAIFSQLVAEMLSTFYRYTRWSILSGLGVYLTFKYILLPIYAPADALFIADVILLAIVADFVWCFPYFGPWAIWRDLPKSLLPAGENERGKDIPADVRFNVSDGKAVINVENSTVPIRGYGHVWILRESWWDYRFEFAIEPGQQFYTKIKISREYSSWDPIWCSRMVLQITEPKELISVRAYLPEERGVKQKIMEAILNLSEKIWNNILGTKKVNYN